MRSQEMQGYHQHIFSSLFFLILHLSFLPLAHSISSVHDQTSIHRQHLPFLKRQYIQTLLQRRISATSRHKANSLSRQKYLTYLNHQAFSTLYNRQASSIDDLLSLPHDHTKFTSLHHTPKVNYHQSIFPPQNTFPLPSQDHTMRNEWDAGQTSIVNEETEVWQLDEEPVVTSNNRSTKSKGESKYNMGGVWWRVTSPDDPAEGAEPAKWDGDGVEGGVYKNDLQDYEVLQDEWTEEAVI